MIRFTYCKYVVLLNHILVNLYFTLLERTTTTIRVDNTGKDLSTVFAPYHVNHNFIRPSVFGLYLIQRASGFFLKQFKTAIRHKLLDIFDTRQILSRCLKSLPFLNIMAVVTHCNSLSPYTNFSKF